jgi:quercetin dioxygenase-like cupin family protein
VTVDSETGAICEMAALYALGALDGDDLWRYSAHLVGGCDACEWELAAFDDVAEALASIVEPVRPAPILRDRLLDRVRGVDYEHDTLEELARSAAVEGSEEQWQPHRIPGVEVKTLFVDEAKREAVMLVRAAAGVRYPSHRHAAFEDMFMLAGELRFGDRVYAAGDYIRSECGSIHEPSETRTGCMFLLRGSLDNELVD